MTDTERLDFLDDHNPIVFHRSSEDDSWELVVDAHLTAGVGRSYLGLTLRQATDFAIEGERQFAASRPTEGK